MIQKDILVMCTSESGISSKIKALKPRKNPHYAVAVVNRD